MWYFFIFIQILIKKIVKKNSGDTDQMWHSVCLCLIKSIYARFIKIMGSSTNRGVSHYRILPVSRDIGWPVQQLDYFRYIKQHILTIELLYIGYNFQEIKKRHLLIDESDKTACHYGHLWLHLYTVFILCWPKLHPVLSSMSAPIIKSCARVFSTSARVAFFEVDPKPS